MYRYFVLICIFFFNASVASAQTPMNATEAALDLSVTKMSLEEKVGQLFMRAYREEEGKPVTAVTQTIKDEIEKYHLGGVILFRENFVDIKQTVRLNRDLQRLAGAVPLFIAVDQEGGRVDRFSFGTNLPGNMALGASGKGSNAYITGAILGQELRALGINIDLAPDLDVNSNQDNPVIGLRSFGADAEMAGEMGARFLAGLHDNGVMAAVKHFPGHGDTSVDSHLGLPCVLYDKGRLNNVELKPFIRNIAAADMVMVAHVAFPSLDSTTVISQKDGQPVFLPASLSYKILTELLREDLGYDGVIISDALEMKAITEHFGPEEAVVQAVLAGVDILLMPSDVAKAYAGVIEAVKSGTISEVRINQSVKRILRLKQRFKTDLPGEAQQIVGSDKHIAEEQRLADQAATLLKNEQSMLPFDLRSKSIVVFAPWQELADKLEEAARRELNNKAIVTAINYEDQEVLSEKERIAISEADYVVLGTYSSTAASRLPERSKAASFARAAAEYLNGTGKKYAVLALGTPYDIAYLHEVPAYLAIYGTNTSNIRAGMAAIFGRLNPQGKLPVPIQRNGEVLFTKGTGLHY